MRNFIKIALVLGTCIAGIAFIHKFEGKSQPVHATDPPPDTVDSLPEFMSKPAKEGLKEALIYYSVKYPDIVYAQAILETGHFKSVGCVKHNNLFGLYNSRAKRYCRFNHWAESILAYKEWIQKKYNPPENYYNFLKRIHYASDPTYIPKLKQIVKKEHDKRRYTEGDTISKGS